MWRHHIGISYTRRISETLAVTKESTILLRMGCLVAVEGIFLFSERAFDVYMGQELGDETSTDFETIWTSLWG